MGEDDEIVEKVNKTNTEFYCAFENLSIEMMDNLWKHDENIVCIHPGWDLFTGWLAIRESWITIFANMEMIKFTFTNTRLVLLLLTYLSKVNNQISGYLFITMVLL
jgi:hypothetical protein